MKRNFFSHSSAALYSALSIKKIVLTAIAAMLWLSQAAAAPGETLLNLFNRAFPDAKHVIWAKDQDYHVVSFTRNETHCKIWYDKDGTLIYSLRHCQESELPLKVVLAVRKAYRDKQITGATELTNRSGVSYELILSDSRKWYVVNCTSYGDVSLKYSLKKQE